jgi:hypothetical protein
MEDRLSIWESEGGATGRPQLIVLTGTVNQIEWAERIRLQVDAEFDRVARVLKAAANKQSRQRRIDTFAMVAILEEKRLEVLANPKAGYFIRDWQELSDQVRQLILQDARSEFTGVPSLAPIRTLSPIPSRRTASARMLSALRRQTMASSRR